MHSKSGRRKLLVPIIDLYDDRFQNASESLRNLWKKAEIAPQEGFVGIKRELNRIHLCVDII
ncbi:MAG TPA: hypothetical protein VHP63_05155 [candidate division Zixibacteria bacterium]|nr:hypothetical protein [candidate division Zixibacteria bacterium]